MSKFKLFDVGKQMENLCHKSGFDISLTLVQKSGHVLHNYTIVLLLSPVV